jgi:hypothetical protein
MNAEMLEGKVAHDERPGQRVGYLAPHEFRLLTELEQLKTRMQKLVAFLDGDSAASLRQRDRDLLILQLAHMRAYAEVLTERVERLCA